ncbi:hypothetical protein CRENPOLYSF2_160002 [Crenothrix polyspora]|uniref:Uncharacterized protein n=1 Tax=Crenothrix polyspora TaxID=360316 RepID=A0A1R4H250_9GAMM|nr:hypothetical protein [Crenothrix polyspora]SJM90322.1 hypothetical protein CRENPOLYSF2_160002 [Crenothrix polyspora]
MKKPDKKQAIPLEQIIEDSDRFREQLTYIIANPNEYPPHFAESMMKALTRNAAANTGKKEKARQSAKTLHKDSNADKSHVVEWYKINGHKYANKNLAATAIHEGKHVNSAWQTIRNHLKGALMECIK